MNICKYLFLVGIDWGKESFSFDTSQPGYIFSLYCDPLQWQLYNYTTQEI